MVNVSVKSLLEAGVHFGHQSRKWNPKMKQFIYGERGGLYIFDLQITMDAIKKACQAVADIIAEGETIIFVGTKRQAQDIVAEEAARCGMPYINQRWVGGLLTNFATIRQAIGRYNSFLKAEESAEIERLSKKDMSKFQREKIKLEKNYKGIKNLDRPPGAIFVIDSGNEAIAILESKKMGIPVIGLVDTNSDPDIVDFCIPGNDDAIKSIKLVASRISDAVLEGKALYEEKQRLKEKEEEKVAVKKEPKPLTAEEIEEQLFRVAERERKMKRPLARRRNPVRR